MQLVQLVQWLGSLTRRGPATQHHRRRHHKKLRFDGAAQFGDQLNAEKEFRCDCTSCTNCTSDSGILGDVAHAATGAAYAFRPRTLVKLVQLVQSNLAFFGSRCAARVGPPALYAGVLFNAFFNGL